MHPGISTAMFTLVAWVTAVPAMAQPPEGSPVLKQSTLLAPVLKRIDPGSRLMQASRKAAPIRVVDRRSMDALRVAPAPGASMDLGQVFDQTMASHRSLTANLLRIPAAARVGEPETTEAVVEFPDRLVLVRQTRLVVKDAAQAAQGSPDFAALVAPVDRARIGSLKVAELDPGHQRGFRAFLQGEFKDLPAEDPLRQAFARGGEDAVLRAVLAGEGELEVVDEIEVLREPVLDLKPLMPAGFKVVAPTGEPGASRLGALSSQVPGNATGPKLPGALGKGRIQPAGAFDPATHAWAYPEGERAHGEHVFEAPFLAGYTLGHWQGWSRRWNFKGLGWLRLSLGVGVGVGLRIPVNLKGKVTPTGWERSAPDCPPHTVRYELDAQAFDAPESFYRASGLPENLLFAGQEFVLQAGATLDYKLVAFGETVKEGRINGPGLTRSADFVPPMAQHRNLVTIWLPAEGTNTQIDFGVLKGFVEVGFGLGGRGSVDGTFAPLVDGRLGARESVHLTGAQRTGQFQLPALNPGAPGTLQGKPFGAIFRFERYNMDLTATLKLRAGARIDVSYFERTLTLPALDLFTFRLPGFSLPTHAGTQGTYRWDQGLLAYEHRPAGLKPAGGVKPVRVIKR